MIKKSLTLAFLAWLAVSCGEIKVEDSQHTLSGEPTLTVDWGLDQFSEAFREDCQEQYDRGEIDDVEKCVADKIVELINLIEQGLNNEQTTP